MNAVNKLDQFRNVEKIAESDSGNYYLVSEWARFLDNRQYFVFVSHAGKFAMWLRQFGEFNSLYDEYDVAKYPRLFGDEHG